MQKNMQIVQFIKCNLTIIAPKKIATWYNPHTPVGHASLLVRLKRKKNRRIAPAVFCNNIKFKIRIAFS
jgi:hypothetical protein